MSLLNQGRRKWITGIAGISGLAALGSYFWSQKKSENFNMSDSQLMPTLFIGHGSPMNAIEKNNFTQTLGDLANNFQKPKAILMISAHWMTRGTWVTSMAQPKTIHDFYGFPEELFKVNYPAPGMPELALAVRQNISQPPISTDDHQWGLDHGTWSILKHIYPHADIPVVQLSLDMSQPASYHFELGKQLQFLRKQGVLIMGSGNIVHNLGEIEWDSTAKPYDWAIEFDEWMKKNLNDRNFKSIYSDYEKTSAGKLSVPTPDHFYPLMYVLGASNNTDTLKFDFEGFQNASISMRCMRFG